MSIDKEFKTIDEQVLLLKSRNLQFNDEQTAKELLKKYNYFDIINGNQKIMKIFFLKSFMKFASLIQNSEF